METALCQPDSAPADAQVRDKGADEKAGANSGGSDSGTDSGFNLCTDSTSNAGTGSSTLCEAQCLGLLIALRSNYGSDTGKTSDERIIEDLREAPKLAAQALDVLKVLAYRARQLASGYHISGPLK